MNLIKYLDLDTYEFKEEEFKNDIEVMIVSLDILCGNADYPSSEVKKNSIAW
jgi:hypothetical protein